MPISKTEREPINQLDRQQSAAVMQAHGVAGLRSIAILVSQMPELCNGPRPIRVDMHDGGPAVNVAREPDGAVIVTVADGDA